MQPIKQISYISKIISMSSLNNLSLFLYTLGFVTLTATTPTDASKDYYVYHNCTGSAFAHNSSYQLNLNSLLSSLSSNAATGSSSTGFYNTTVGSDKHSSDTIYGVFMCRGDLPPQLCKECVTNATKRLASDCAIKKEALIWYDKCLVRYSNTAFFSTMDERPQTSLSNKEDYSGELDKFKKLLSSFINDLVILAVAANDEPTAPKRFSVKRAKIDAGGDDDTLYGLAQCLPDLRRENCTRCLRDAVADLDKCCRGKIGARVLYPSCGVRYEIYPFYYTRDVVPALPGKRSQISSLAIILIVVAIAVSLVLCFLSCCILRRKARKNWKATLKENFGEEISKDLESLQFDFGTIEAATNKFSDENMIGKGGFGEVYKGILSDGQEIAVKRLSKRSAQGIVEFKNEILSIARLQHKNLVKLLGFCLEGQEKILVYEYVSNKSLNYFLFDTKRHRQLIWSERYKIIGGIARGILYLHEDSRLKIIHRDIKPSNILLDENMNPKISDFGMAKMITVNQTEENTCRIVGTYGYMSPEYIIHGQFSVKSDVFSFGVMVLEIISGKRNASPSSHQLHRRDDLLNYAWRQWKEQTPLELLDPSLEGCCSQIEALRCIQIGLLCVQEDPDERPTMATVTLMLNSDSLDLPLPGHPAFFACSRTGLNLSNELDPDQSATHSVPLSINEMSMTNFSPRS